MSTKSLLKIWTFSILLALVGCSGVTPGQKAVIVFADNPEHYGFGIGEDFAAAKLAAKRDCMLRFNGNCGSTISTLRGATTLAHVRCLALDRGFFIGPYGERFGENPYLGTRLELDGDFTPEALLMIGKEQLANELPDFNSRFNLERNADFSQCELKASYLRGVFYLDGDPISPSGGQQLSP